jgi:hypothetical protein
MTGENSKHHPLDAQAPMPVWQETLEILRTLKEKAPARAGEDKELARHFVHAAYYYSQITRKLKEAKRRPRTSPRVRGSKTCW